MVTEIRSSATKWRHFRCRICASEQKISTKHKHHITRPRKLTIGRCNKFKKIFSLSSNNAHWKYDHMHHVWLLFNPPVIVSFRTTVALNRWEDFFQGFWISTPRMSILITTYRPLIKNLMPDINLLIEWHHFFTTKIATNVFNSLFSILSKCHKWRNTRKCM